MLPAFDHVVDQHNAAVWETLSSLAMFGPLALPRIAMHVVPHPILPGHRAADAEAPSLLPRLLVQLLPTVPMQEKDGGVEEKQNATSMEMEWSKNGFRWTPDDDSRCEVGGQSEKGLNVAMLPCCHVASCFLTTSAATTNID